MRPMVWIKTAHLQGWCCSECNWTFNPLGPPLGSSLDEMMLNYEREREMEYLLHSCAQHPKPEDNRDVSRFPLIPKIDRMMPDPAVRVDAKARRAI
jgi:hypothetical protein